MSLIRPEERNDATAVRAVNLAAFETAAEANIVDALREQARPLVSLVAQEDEQLVGHIMFSPVSLGGHRGLSLMALAPMAVLPAYQGKGIGSALVRAGLERCRTLGAGAVVVLGHPTYYPRFGFQAAARFGIASEYEAPPEAFLVLELQPGCLSGATGTITFEAAFREA